MISYKREKGRHYFGFSSCDLADMAEVVYLLKHSPPPIGFNRRPLTGKQQRVVDDLFDLIAYPDDYAENLNKKTGQ